MSAPVDVLAVMDADGSALRSMLRHRNNKAMRSDHPESAIRKDRARYLLEQHDAARAAVAELIEADTELDAAIAAYDNAITITMGGVDYVSPSDPAVERFDAAKARRAAALARVGGAA